MLTVAADISAETGTTRVRSSSLLLGLRRSSSACTSSVVVSPSTVTDATAEYEPASTSPGIEVSTVISLLQSITSHAPPGSAQPVSSRSEERRVGKSGNFGTRYRNQRNIIRQ